MKPTSILRVRYIDFTIVAGVVLHDQAVIVSVRGVVVLEFGSTVFVLVNVAFLLNGLPSSRLVKQTARRKCRQAKMRLQCTVLRFAILQSTVVHC